MAVKGGDRFGADRTGNRTQGMTAAQRSNQSRSNRYPLNDYSADFRFKNSGATYQKRPTGMMQIPFGGGGGGGGDILGFAEADYQRQLDLMDKAAEMGAGYSSDNTLGTTDIDYENKMITERLSPELQAEYDALLQRSAAGRDRIAAMGDDPYALQMYLYNQNADLRANEADALRNMTMESLQAKGMLGSTGGSELYGSVEDSIAQADTDAFNQAMMQSQQLLDMERARQQGDLATATALGLKQIPYIQAGTQQGAAIPIKNVEGVSGASRNIFGVQAAESMGSSKRKKGIWDSLLGGGTGGGLLGGLFGF